MANWKHTLNLKVEWEQADEDKITVQQLASIVAAKLSKIDFKDEDVNYDRDEFVDELEGFSEDLTATKNDFDNVWERLYDWADDEHRLWIEIF